MSLTNRILIHRVFDEPIGFLARYRAKSPEFDPVDPKPNRSSAHESPKVFRIPGDPKFYVNSESELGHMLVLCTMSCVRRTQYEARHRKLELCAEAIESTQYRNSAQSCDPGNPDLYTYRNRYPTRKTCEFQRVLFSWAAKGTEFHLSSPGLFRTSTAYV